MNIDGRTLEMARLGLGLSREELANRLDVSPRTIANWENNGVPNHRVNLVMSRIGTAITSAATEIEYMDFLKTPSGRKQQEEAYERDSKYLSDREVSRLELSIRELLRPYSTESLIEEVRTRVSELESKVRNLEDPDYSKMSVEDVRNSYDLAALAKPEHIGDDELPHEP